MNFETAPVHPVDLSPSAQFLAVAHLADNRVLIFDLTEGSPVLSRAIPVGIDPVSARFRTDTELWVVNHISDTITIVDASNGAVTGLIQTLDEPADVVFAGNPVRAFVTCSQVNTIQVFDTTTHGVVEEMVLDAEDPRALAVSPDGNTVYAAIFESGNRSTLLGGGSVGPGTISFPPNVVDDANAPHGVVNPAPNNGAQFSPPKNPANGTPPPVGLIVKQDSEGLWRDDTGANWTELVSGNLAAQSGRPVGWELLDHDIAIIDANDLSVDYIDHLMNIGMALAVNPGTGAVTLVGTDATNEIRFEPVVNGTFLRVLYAAADPDTGQSTTIADLNAAHVNGYATRRIPQAQRNRSIGDPRGIVWNSAGTTAYVTGMGSNNLVVINTQGVRAGQADTIELGEGPTGLALDEERQQLYVWNRFAASLSVISTESETELSRLSVFDPTPAAIRTGRKHLYDTHKTSGLGQIACASCHVDARMDRLAWDLGDPAGDLLQLTNRNLGGDIPGLNEDFQPFHPMKGPMSTQTFQGIIGQEPFHWRGDRLGLEDFNPAFKGLQADDTELTPTEMQEYEDFLATIHFPPNPYRNLDNTLPTSLPLPDHFVPHQMDVPAGTPLPNGNARDGLDLYRDHVRRIDGDTMACVTCHSLPSGNGPNARFNGTSIETIPDGPRDEKHLMLVSIDGSTNRSLKVAQLRNLYDKVGMTMLNSPSRAGFGFLHDGSVDTLERFLSENAFNTATAQELANLVALMLAFSGSDFEPDATPPAIPFLDIPGEPSKDVHAAVGQQTEVDPAAKDLGELAQFVNIVETSNRVELVAHFPVNGIQRGARYQGNDSFERDAAGSTITTDALLASVDDGGTAIFTIVAAGTANRIALDRDQDSYYDYDEVLAGSDPADPESFGGGGEGEGEGELLYHSADTNEDYAISLSELLRIVQFYNSDRLGCQDGTEDGFQPNGTSETCAPHKSDYAPQDWRLNLNEVLRLIQVYNIGGYELCEGSEDGICPVAP
ncbi:MAG: YncE family protein [Candidatus Hydrogenedentes bacterium]|nr:YncE family protein [Candidatus Hydrogenedentota bacterium]